MNRLRAEDHHEHEIRHTSAGPVCISIAVCPRPVAVADDTSTTAQSCIFARKGGKPTQAISEIQELLDSNLLDSVSSGKAWNILGLAYDDQGDLALSQHAYEESLRILESLPDNVREYAMALDDFGGHYLATDQFEIANRLRMKALSLYERIGDHAGIVRTSADLAGTAFSQRKVGDCGEPLR